MKRLIFDLRGNSGGYLEQAAAISNQFIANKDTLVFTKEKYGSLIKFLLLTRKKVEKIFH